MKLFIKALLAALLLPQPSVAHEAPQTDAAKRAYIEENIKLFETVATKIDTYRGKGVPAVKFALKNEGLETLNMVEVVVYFLDETGEPFFEENYFPVLVSEYKVDGKPLKPNYTYRMKSDRFYTVENLGDEWSGQARFEIVDIKFAE